VTSTILFAHPSDDHYGADAMLVHSANAAARSGFRVVVAAPGGAPRLGSRVPSATMLAVDVPVLRQALQRTALGVPTFLCETTASIVPLTRIIRKWDPKVLLVNTVTIPAWIIAARLARCPVIVHVHELEPDRSRWTRRLLYLPLLLSPHVLVPSHAARQTVTATYKTLADRVSVLHNPVRVPPTLPPPSPFSTELSGLL
jgi:hypothetical protein